ncbi:MAG: DUF1638 domain-containing protein [Deferrisomatales bacterium]|nr:DUF1638 domain-containing protein [Deferrisomatales bacterium]
MQPNPDCASLPRHPKLLVCRALAHLLEPLVGPEVETVVLDIALHVKPERLREALQDAVASLEEAGGVILLGYGLCGRATEGVVSRLSTLVLPRVDDCVGALLGSRRRHQEFMKQRPGCYFLEPTWVDAEMNIFVQLEQHMERIPPHRRGQIARLTLKHYRSLALLTGGGHGAEAERRCRGYARANGLEFIEVETELGLLERIVGGPWSAEEFVVCPPGVPIPLF